jgi:hypothetical protein
MTLFRSGACSGLITVALCFSACGDGDGKGSGGSAKGGSATATGGSATATGGSATGGSGGRATTTGGSPNSESAGAGGQLGSVAGAGGTDDSPPASTGGTAGESSTAGTGGGDCMALAPAQGLVLDGDARITTAADVEALREFSEITGSLEVATSEPLDVGLPQLRHVGGDLRAESTKLRRFSAPRLESLDGVIWFYLNHEMIELDLRNLSQVGTRVFIHRNLGLRALQLEALVNVDGMEGVEISGNLALPDCFLDLLDERFSLLRTTAPECSCTRSCGLIEADCP